MRERTDKSLPNACSTAESVVSSIKNPIMKETLIDFIEKHCRRGVKRPFEDAGRVVK